MISLPKAFRIIHRFGGCYDKSRNYFRTNAVVRNGIDKNSGKQRIKGTIEYNSLVESRDLHGRLCPGTKASE